MSDRSPRLSSTVWRAAIAAAVLTMNAAPIGDLPNRLSAGQETKESTPAASSTSIRATGAELVKVSSEFKFTEGPATDSSGAVYFTDQPNDRIMKLDVDGKLSTYLSPSGRSNGLCFDVDGALWACADEKNELWKIAPDKKKEVVLSTYEGKLLNAPNDLWIAPGGLIFFTDPFYKRDYWTRGGPEQSVQGVYRLSVDRKKLDRVIDDLKQPNGVIGSPDGKLLYVADIGAGKTYVYDLDAEGTLSNKREFCKLGSDGMTIDDQGDVYLTGKGVTVFNQTGEKIDWIDVPEPWTANVCFGGADRSTLVITAGKSLYTLKTRVKGVGSQ